MIPNRSKAEILSIRRAHLGRNLSVSYQDPLKIVRGRAQYLYDEHGRRYLDCVNNVCHVGHCHPRVVEAGQEQLARLNTNTRYLHDNVTEYALRLTATLPDPLSVCFFVNSGSEANELALRLARNHTGRSDVIVLEHAYHGHTQALIDVSPYKYDRAGGRGRPPTTHVAPLPYPYRDRASATATTTTTADRNGPAYAEAVAALAQHLAHEGHDVAAFLAESIAGCGGQVFYPASYFERAFEPVRALGGLCLIDEVQVGFGRVGTHFWAFETQGVVPDIVTMGKPIGNGFPMAAVVATAEIADSFANGMEYFNTFGGNPVASAIGLAVLDVIEDEGLQEHARKVGDAFIAGLRSLQQRHALIGDVRGLGLFLGVELVNDRTTQEPATLAADAVIQALREHGILLSTDGPFNNVLKIKPPMVFSAANADEVVTRLDAVLSEVEGAR